MDKYSLQKYEIYRHQMCSFKFQMHQNPFSAGAYSAGETPKEAKVRQTCPGFFLKSLLESPGNLLD